MASVFAWEGSAASSPAAYGRVAGRSPVSRALCPERLGPSFSTRRDTQAVLSP